MLKPVKSRIKGTLIHAQNIVGKLADTLRNGPSMHRLERENLQDEKVERSLKQLIGSRQRISPLSD